MLPHIKRGVAGPATEAPLLGVAAYASQVWCSCFGTPAIARMGNTRPGAAICKQIHRAFYDDTKRASIAAQGARPPSATALDFGDKLLQSL